MKINEAISQELTLDKLDEITKNLTYTKGTIFGGRHIRTMTTDESGEILKGHTSVSKLLNAFEGILNNELEDSIGTIDERLNSITDPIAKKKLENIALNILTVHHNAKGGLFTGKDKPLANELTAYFKKEYGLDETTLKNLEVFLDNKINEKYEDKSREASIDLFVQIANSDDSRLQNIMLNLVPVEKQEAFLDKVLGDILNEGSIQQLGDLEEFLETQLKDNINSPGQSVGIQGLFQKIFPQKNAFRNLDESKVKGAVNFLMAVYKNIKDDAEENHTEVKSSIAQIIMNYEQKAQENDYSDSSSWTYSSLTSSSGNSYTGSTSGSYSEDTTETSSSNVGGPMEGVNGGNSDDIAVSFNKDDNSSWWPFNQQPHSSEDWSDMDSILALTSESNENPTDVGNLDTDKTGTNTPNFQESSSESTYDLFSPRDNPPKNVSSDESSESTEENLYGLFDSIESSNSNSTKADMQSLEESSSYQEIEKQNAPEVPIVEKEEPESVYQDPGVQTAENTQKPIKAKVEEETDYTGISRIFKGNIERQKDTSKTDFSLLGKMFKTDEEEEIAPEPKTTTGIITSHECLINIERFYTDYLEAQENFLSGLNKNLSTPEARKKALQDAKFDETYRADNRNMIRQLLNRDFKKPFESKYEEGFLPCLKFVNQEDVKALMPPKARQKMIAMFLLKKALNPNIYHDVDYKSSSLLFNEVPLNDKSLNKDDIIHFMYACLSLDKNRSIPDGINIPKKGSEKDRMINELKDQVNEMLNDSSFELSDRYRGPISEFINA